MIRVGTAADLPWIGRLLSEAPEAADWLPDNHPFLVAEPEAGFLVWRQVAEDECEILNLAVSPALRRRGVGRSLVMAAIARGGRWFLEVRASNFSARHFYNAVGFREAGQRRNYYRDPIEDAVLLARTI